MASIVLRTATNIIMSHLWVVLTIFLLLSTPSKVLSGQLDINEATASQLQELPFIGAARAKAIIRYRKINGPISNLEEINKIPAIGPITFRAIKPYLTTSKQFPTQHDSPQPQEITRVFPRINTHPGQITLLPDSHYFDKLISYIQSAKSEIEITMFIFKTTKSKKNRAALVVRELVKAKKRGVKIRVVLDKSNYDKNINKENKKVARELRKSGIKVYFDSEKKTTHSKLIVIDQRYCFIGSHNLTHSALTYNNEYSILIDSYPLAKELSSYIRHIQ